MSVLEGLDTIDKPLRIDALSAEATSVSVNVGDADRKVLAERYDYPGIEALEAKVDVTRYDTLVRAVGSLTATLTRQCGVSLEPMTEEISEEFAVEYTTEFSVSDAEEIEIDLDAPEPLEGEVLNVGDIVMEQLVLAADPYPRKEGAKPPADPKAGQESNPFDVLKALKS